MNGGIFKRMVTQMSQTKTDDDWKKRSNDGSLSLRGIVSIDVVSS